MKYFSFCTGVGGFEYAIDEVFEDAECVGYSEYDKFADKTYLKNYPEHEGLNIGDLERFVFDIGPRGILVVNEARVRLLPDFDLLVGGPSCQDLSIAKTNREGLAGKKSRIFFAFLAILKIKKPKYFLMENVSSMSHKNRDLISEYLGVEVQTIRSDKFTPQKRVRHYWPNWKVPELPKGDGPRWPALVAWSSSNDYDKDGKHEKFRERETRDGRANTLTTGKGCGNYSSKNYIETLYNLGTCADKRILTPSECEQLQGFPCDWTKGVSDSQRYKQMGNAINIPTVIHILGGLKNELKRKN